jgi:hypothetical protein
MYFIRFFVRIIGYLIFCLTFILVQMPNLYLFHRHRDKWSPGIAVKFRLLLWHYTKSSNTKSLVNEETFTFP